MAGPPRNETWQEDLRRLMYCGCPGGDRIRQLLQGGSALTSLIAASSDVFTDRMKLLSEHQDGWDKQSLARLNELNMLGTLNEQLMGVVALAEELVLEIAALMATDIPVLDRADAIHELTMVTLQSHGAYYTLAHSPDRLWLIGDFRRRMLDELTRPAS